MRFLEYLLEDRQVAAIAFRSGILVNVPTPARFALHKLQALMQRALKAYDTYEFHVIYHRLYNYCTVDLSAFYLDVLKDRLYTSGPATEARRCNGIESDPNGCPSMLIVEAYVSVALLQS